MIHRMRPEDILSALEVGQSLQRRRALEHANHLQRQTILRQRARTSAPKFTPGRAK